MVISIRVDEEREQKYREFAAREGLTVSEFMRRAADEVIAQAEELLRKADEERRHAEEVEDFKRRLAEYKQSLVEMGVRQYTDEELDEIRLAQYA